MSRLLPLFPALALALTGCDAMQNLKLPSGAGLNFGGGSNSSSNGVDAGSLFKAANQVRKGFADISESEEYYIGRAVAAQILGRYKPYGDPKVNLYAQAVLQTVASASDRPDTFKGYHLQVLDSDEINAFATPGGFVFVTRGLIALTKSEDELACVLAHEVAHVSRKHGLKTIKTARLTAAFALLGSSAAKRYGSDEVAKLTSAFEGSIDDVVGKLVVDGYSRDKEYEADAYGAKYAAAANYDPNALKTFLKRMDGVAASGGMFKTHPPAGKRASELGALTASSAYAPSPERDRRFAVATASAR